jgi:hypothetical protein
MFDAAKMLGVNSRDIDSIKHQVDDMYLDSKTGHALGDKSSILCVNAACF